MRLRTVILLLLALPILTGQALAFERAELIPENLFFLRVDNAQETWSALDKLLVSKLRRDEQFQQFATAYETKLTRKDSEAKVSGFFRFLQIFGPALKGELTVGISDKGPEGQSHSYLAVAMSKALYEKSLARGEWVFEQSQVPVETVNSMFQNHPVIQLITDKGTNGIEQCWISHLDQTMLISNDKTWIEQSMVTLQKNRVEEPAGNSVEGSLPIQAWIQRSLQKKPERKRQNMNAVLSVLGLLGVEQYRFELLLEKTGLLWNGNLEVDSLTTGLFALLDMAPIPAMNPNQLSDTTSSFFCTHVDPAGFWNKLPEMAAGLPNGAAGQLNMLESTFLQQTGISLEEDVFQHAGEILTTWTETIGTNQHVAASLSLTDDRALQNTLDRFVGSPMGTALTRGMKTETFRDRSVYSLYKTAALKPMVNFCITDNLLVLTGEQPEPIHNLIQRIESPVQENFSALAESARRFAPRSAYSFGATDHQEAVSYLSARLSDTSFNLYAGVESRPKHKEAKNAGLAENEISFNYVSAFLGDSFNYAEVTDQGIHHQIMFKYNETEGAN